MEREKTAKRIRRIRRQGNRTDPPQLDLISSSFFSYERYHSRSKLDLIIDGDVKSTK